MVGLELAVVTPPGCLGECHVAVDAEAVIEIGGDGNARLTHGMRAHHRVRQVPAADEVNRSAMVRSHAPRSLGWPATDGAGYLDTNALGRHRQTSCSHPSAARPGKIRGHDPPSRPSDWVTKKTPIGARTVQNESAGLAQRVFDRSKDGRAPMGVVAKSFEGVERPNGCDCNRAPSENAAI